MINNKTVYLAGKVTGDPDYKNKFLQSAAWLKSEGYVVLHPALLPDNGFSYDAYMRITRAMLDECDSVCFLKDWQDSNGAKDEYDRAIEKNKEIFFFDSWAKAQTVDMWQFLNKPQNSIFSRGIRAENKLL